MNKIILGAAVLALFATASCSKQESAEDQAFKVDKGLSDSISTYYGRMVGGYVLADFDRFGEEHHTPQVKEDIIKGVRMAFANNGSEGTLIGLQVGMRMISELKSLEEQGVEVDRDATLKEFIRNFSADSINTDGLQEASALYSGMMQRVEAVAQARREAEAAKAPEAIQNELSGKAFVDKAKAADPAIKTTDSGLSYKIENPGDTARINAGSTIKLNYTGRLIDGTVFDSSEQHGGPATFSVGGVIPGFREGLMMLGNGGKATFYIPANLGYGVNGVPQAGIGPNSTLVFDVEILEVTNP